MLPFYHDFFINKLADDAGRNTQRRKIIGFALWPGICCWKPIVGEGFQWGVRYFICNGMKCMYTVWAYSHLPKIRSELLYNTKTKNARGFFRKFPYNFAYNYTFWCLIVTIPVILYFILYCRNIVFFDRRIPFTDKPSFCVIARLVCNAPTIDLRVIARLA